MKAPPHSRGPQLARLVTMARLVADVQAARAQRAQADMAALRDSRDRLDAGLRAVAEQDGSIAFARFGIWSRQARAAINLHLPAADAQAARTAQVAVRSSARAAMIQRLAQCQAKARRSGSSTRS